MRFPKVAVRAVALLACLIAFGAACPSSDDTADPSNETTSTTNASQKANEIPFNVGERVGLPNDWLVQITSVDRPYADPQLPDPADGREYVGVDISMTNLATTTRTVDTAALFEVGDSEGGLNPVLAVPGEQNGLDGGYAPDTERSGRLVFDVPTEAALRLAMDGPLIGTQHAIFMVDPPTVPAGD